MCFSCRWSVVSRVSCRTWRRGWSSRTPQTAVCRTTFIFSKRHMGMCLVTLYLRAEQDSLCFISLKTRPSSDVSHCKKLLYLGLRAVLFAVTTSSEEGKALSAAVPVLYRVELFLCWEHDPTNTPAAMRPLFGCSMQRFLSCYSSHFNSCVVSDFINHSW